MIIKFFLGLLEEIFITIFVNICFRFPVACVKWWISNVIHDENKPFKDFYKRKIVIYYLPQLGGFLLFGMVLMIVLFIAWSVISNSINLLK
jgi:hypothetical protein